MKHTDNDDEVLDAFYAGGVAFCIEGTAEQLREFANWIRSRPVPPPWNSDADHEIEINFRIPDKYRR